MVEILKLMLGRDSGRGQGFVQPCGRDRLTGKEAGGRGRRKKDFDHDEATKSSMAAKISAFEARVVDQDKRIAELEQRTSFHLVGLGIGLGLGLLLFKWMGKA